jgi:hypothetical protein
MGAITILSSESREIDLARLAVRLQHADIGDSLQRRNQIAQGFEVPIAAQHPFATEIVVYGGNRSGDVSYLMRDRADRNARSGEQLMESGDFVGPELLRGVQHHGRQPGSGIGLIGGKRDVGEEGFAVFALAACLHYGPVELRRNLRSVHIAQRWQIAMDAPPGQGSGRHTQHAMRGLVRHQHVALGIRGEDGRRAAFNQDLQLLFSFPPSFAFALDLFEVLLHDRAVAIHLAYEESGAQESGKVEQIARSSGARAPRKTIEGFSQKSAKRRRRADWQRLQHAPDQEHGQQIKKAQRDLVDYAPVQDRDRRDHHRRANKDGAGAPTEERSVGPRR